MAKSLKGGIGIALADLRYEFLIPQNGAIGS